MTRTITDTADRLRTCDMLTMDDTLRKQTPVRLPRIVLVEGIAACSTHTGCIAIAVADPNSSLSDQPAATLHVHPGYILTWTGDFSHAGSTGFRPGGVDLDRPAPKTVTETITADQLTTSRMLLMACERIETVTTVDLTRPGFVQFHTDDRPEGTNLPYVYRPDDTLTALA